MKVTSLIRCSRNDDSLVDHWEWLQTNLTGEYEILIETATFESTTAETATVESSTAETATVESTMYRNNNQRKEVQPQMW